MWKTFLIGKQQKRYGHGTLLELVSMGLERTDPGFDGSLLTDFGDWLLEHQVEHRIYEHLVNRLSDRGWIKKRGVQRTDSPHGDRQQRVVSLA